MLRSNAKYSNSKEKKKGGTDTEESPKQALKQERQNQMPRGETETDAERRDRTDTEMGERQEQTPRGDGIRNSHRKGR